MPGIHRLTRRTALKATTGLVTLGVAGLPLTGFAQGATPVASPVADPGLPLWQAAAGNGLTYGTSLATWQADDPDYLAIVDREAALLFTEDDLLFWRLKPTPDAAFDFQYADRFYGIAEAQGQLVLGAHLVWDQGFGEGWTDDDIWGLGPDAARALMLDTINSVVGRYKGRTAAWIVVNEIIDAHEADGLRTDYPWTNTIGKSVAEEAFAAAHAVDPDALLILNEFGFETDSEWDAAADKREKALIVIDNLLAAGAPVQALGVQAHLSAANFAENFDAAAYTAFLGEVASRGLKIIITEMDALDDDLPAEIAPRDAAIAEAYSTYLAAALAEPELAAVITFGLSDRYTWLQEDYPRDDGEERRPLAFDSDLQPKPAYDAIRDALLAATARPPLWTAPRER